MSAAVHPLKRNVINLAEQEPRPVSLLPGEASFLAQILKFQVTSSGPGGDGQTASDGRSCFLVNPGQYVGHFLLPTNTVVAIAPKIPTACVFRMLAYVYALWDFKFFREEEVAYKKDQFLFEPFVELFADLTEKRIRRGLFQDYVRREENLAVLKGGLKTSSHVAQNYLRHPERAFCRYYENTCDNEDNQIVRWTISRLPTDLFSQGVARRLRANFHQMDPVTLVPPSRDSIFNRHYHRLNEDYGMLHRLCRLLLEGCSISEQVGDTPFHGFLLDMNKLFEKFVTQAFLEAAREMAFVIRPQELSSLSQDQATRSIQIEPDIVVRLFGNCVSIVDAKYKRTRGAYENHDFYQVISYGTSLACHQTHLFYPASEYEAEETISIRNSQISVRVHRIDIEDKDCVRLAEKAAKELLASCSISLAA